MEYSKLGLALTERSEGCRLTAYPDEGAFSIGYGHRGVPEGSTCTQEQADEWLCQDIQHAANFVNKVVKVPLTQSEFDALVDFVYNVGTGNFQDSTMLQLLNQGLYQSAALEFRRWNKAGGHIVANLIARRAEEEKEFTYTDPEEFV